MIQGQSGNITVAPEESEDAFRLIFDDQDLETVIANMVQVIESSEPARLTNFVGEQGLVFAPFGVVVQEQGLAGAELINTLGALVKGTRLKVLGYNSEYPWRIDMIVKGFNPVEITPAVGEAFMMTETGSVVWRLNDKDTWELWIISDDGGGLTGFDSYGMSEENINPPAFEATLPAAEMPMISPSPGDAALNLIETMKAFNIQGLMDMVPEDGLAIYPYGGEVVYPGVKGEALRATLESLLAGAQPELVAFDFSENDNIRLVIIGLNPVVIKAASGMAFTVTGEVIVELETGFFETDRPYYFLEGVWKFTQLAVDTDGLLSQAMTKPPYLPSK